MKWMFKSLKHVVYRSNGLKIFISNLPPMFWILGAFLAAALSVTAARPAPSRSSSLPVKFQIRVDRVKSEDPTV